MCLKHKTTLNKGHIQPSEWRHSLFVYMLNTITKWSDRSQWLIFFDSSLFFILNTIKALVLIISTLSLIIDIDNIQFLNRFSLLILEPNEIYFEDFLVTLVNYCISKTTAKHFHSILQFFFFCALADHRQWHGLCTVGQWSSWRRSTENVFQIIGVWS